jgi:hypothetical protein
LRAIFDSELKEEREQKRTGKKKRKKQSEEGKETTRAVGSPASFLNESETSCLVIFFSWVGLKISGGALERMEPERAFFRLMIEPVLDLWPSESSSRPSGRKVVEGKGEEEEVGEGEGRLEGERKSLRNSSSSAGSC